MDDTADARDHGAGGSRANEDARLAATHNADGIGNGAAAWDAPGNSRARVVAQRRAAEAQTETAWRAHSRCAGPAESCSTRRRAGCDERRCE